MPVVNIVDRRKKPYRWKRVLAIVEPACQDNSVKDSDQAEKPMHDWSYDERDGISVQEAIAWAGRHIGQTTLFLRDEGDNETVSLKGTV